MEIVMPENLCPSNDPPTESTTEPARTLSPPAAPATGEPDHGAPSPGAHAVPTVPLALPPEAFAMVELEIGRAHV